MSELVHIQTCLNRTEAEVIKSLLEINGIKAIISADDCGGTRPHLVFATGGVKILVKKEDAQKAKAMLEAP